MFDPTETPRSCTLTSDALDDLEDAAAAIGSPGGKMSLVRAKRREVDAAIGAHLHALVLAAYNAGRADERNGGAKS